MRVHIRGLEIMNDDPGEVDVLYAKVSAIASALSFAVGTVIVTIVSRSQTRIVAWFKNCVTALRRGLSSAV